MRRGLVLGFSCLAVILCVCFLFSLVCGVILSIDILGADLLTVAIFCDIQMLCSACKAELKASVCRVGGQRRPTFTEGNCKAA